MVSNKTWLTDVNLAYTKGRADALNAIKNDFNERLTYEINHIKTGVYVMDCIMQFRDAIGI